MILLACPSCARQYDVTHMEPEDKVRCLCDEIFYVGLHKELAAQAMICSNCGGAVRNVDEACAFCEAALTEESRAQTTLCPKCFARLGDDSLHCNQCGVTIQPQALTPLPDKSCPRCDGELRIRMIDPTDAIECSKCGGLWLEPRVFEHACHVAESTPDLRYFEKSDVSFDSGVEKRAYIPCLRCDQLMQRRLYRHNERATGVVVDWCRHHGVWLDHREMETIVSFIRTGGARTGSIKASPTDIRAAVQSPSMSIHPPPSRASVMVGGVLGFLGELMGASLWD